MTTDTEEVELTEEQAEAAFAAWYVKARGEPAAKDKPDAETLAATEKSAAELEVEAKAKADAEKAEADAKAAAEAKAVDEAAYNALPKALREKVEKLEALPGTIDKLAGHVGGFKRQLDTALATAKAAATSKGSDTPTDKQVQVALADPEAWKRLKEDFPDWAGPVEAEFTALRTELAKQTKPDLAGIKKEIVGAVQPMFQSVKAEARALALIDFKHPGWEETVNTTEFKSWVNTQAPEVKALVDSTKAPDAVKMLDLYAGHRTALAIAEAERLKKERRLAGAVTPKGTSQPITTGIDDQQAFERGYRRARGK